MVEGVVITAHSNSSGYVYLNIPRLLCLQTSVKDKTKFLATVVDGRLIMQQQQEGTHVVLGIPGQTAR